MDKKLNQKKKTIKINFEHFWKGFDKKDNFFTKILKKHYNVIITSKDPKYVFFSVYDDDFKQKNIKWIGDLIRSVFPNLYIFVRKIYAKLTKKPLPSPTKKNSVRIFFNLEYQKPEMDKCDWAFSYVYEDEINHPRYMRIPEYYFGGAGKDLIKKQNFAKKTKNQKTKFCNFIYSNEVKSRNEFFKKISKYKKIDSPAKCMNNMLSLEKKGRVGLTTQEWMKNKLKFMKAYKFTIAFENRIIPGYTDEKIYHAMLSGSIPIYVGNPLIGRDFNTKSFINYGDYKNMEKFIERIIEIDTNDKEYEKMLKQPWYNGNKPSEWVNEKKMVKRLKEIFG